ncbi:GNAT family N-acetyltransferase [Tessaracoccus sp. ZS01]|uniref:GNAT family N-acetyltransferase n=1 Tax=Tessaracoccus sp. ZS01 TaxID=1906324 RepID=UPI0009FADCFF|nr:GNAT family N-acetyltransferase [Tessaracoccus sp. ZS01]MCG6566678.1 GNAT family N-acetyltransferase [Tessaracoccus sp. ZS01]
MSAIDTVRLALPQEAVDIARIQRRAWTDGGVLSAAAGEVSADEATRAWHEAIVKPPLAHLRVLVAIAEAGVVGFAVTGPSADPDRDVSDGYIAEFVVDPKHRGQGHGSRLINAAVDTLRKDGYQVATMWVPSADDSLRQFLNSCGWAPDGAHQRVGVGEDEAAAIKLLRFHTDISDAG